MMVWSVSFIGSPANRRVETHGAGHDTPAAHARNSADSTIRRPGASSFARRTSAAVRVEPVEVHDVHIELRRVEERTGRRAEGHAGKWTARQHHDVCEERIGEEQPQALRADQAGRPDQHHGTLLAGHSTSLTADG
jgi:hypothetical protein